MNTIRTLLITTALALSAAATPASAAFVVDTGHGPIDAPGWVLDPNQSLAGYFTLAADTTIQSVEGFLGGSGGTSTITIYGDATLPTTALFSASFEAASGYDWQGVFGQNWSLAAGSYWVGFSSTGENGMTYGGTPNPLSRYAFTAQTVWYPNPLNVGVRIADTPAVPEPASWMMLILGFGAMGGAMRYGRRKTTVSFAA